MKSEEGHSALTSWVIVTLYLCVGMLWLGAQAGVLGYFDVSLNRQSLRWQIGLFIVWLLAHPSSLGCHHRGSSWVFWGGTLKVVRWVVARTHGFL